MDEKEVRQCLDGYLQDYLKGNRAARTWQDICQIARQEMVIDHITFRCLDVAKRAEEFLRMGFTFSEKVDYPDQGWWANVYRCKDFPAIFIDQDYVGYEQGIIKPWVEVFGDKILHHIAVLVQDIEQAKQKMGQAGVRFPADIAGEKGSPLRQIFTAAEVRAGKPFSVLEMAERGIDPRTGKLYTGFINLQADQLMKDSLKT